MNKIKWGIISTGHIASSFAKEFPYCDQGELTAIASRSMETAEQFAQKFDIPRAYGSYADLYNDPDVQVVYVATPHNFHFRNAIDALRSGKAVMCEKPMTVNSQECRELIQVSQTTGNYLMEAMWTYFLPAIKQAQDWIKKDHIGSIKQIRADFGHIVPSDPHGRLYNPELAGGALLDLGVYPIALAWLLLKKDPKIIRVIANMASTGVDDDVLMTFEYDDCIASLCCSFRYRLPNYAYIVGTEGIISIPDFWRTRECFLYKGEECVEHFADPRESRGFKFQVDAVNADLIAGRKESLVAPLSYSLKIQEHMELVMNKIHDS